MISLVVAHANNNVIGINNQMPWHIPEDSKHFKEVTLEHPVIMGRKTYESILNSLGKPLPGRRNIVVSSQTIDRDDIEIVNNLKDALEKVAGEDAFIIGGTQLYQAALDQGIVDRMYITRIDASYDGDAFFPEYDLAEWEELDNRPSKTNNVSYRFITYQKKEA